MSIAATQDYSYMGDPQLQQALQFAQRSNDTPKFLGLMAEINRRKQMRTAAQGQQAGQEASQQPTTVADKVMAGIANLSSGDHNYANGGIVAFARGGNPGDEYMTDSKGNPYTHLWHAEGSSDTDTPYLESVSKALGFPIEVIKRVIGAPDQKDYGQKQRRTAAAAPVPAPASAPMYTPTTPGVVPAEAGVTEKLLPRTEPRAPGPARPAPAATPATPAAAPASTDITVEATDTPEQLAAKRTALAAKDDEGISAVYKRMADRDAAKQAALEAQTGGSEGLFGLSRDKNLALRDFFLNMAATKSPTLLGAAGEAGKVAAANYEAGEKSRLSRQDLLDEAADKRALSEIAAKQGNLDRAAKLQADADTLKMHAQNFGAKKAELTQRERHQLQQEQIAREQMAKQLETARIHASAANRATDADKYIAAAMKEDPKLTYTQAYDKYALGKGAPRSMDTLHAAWSRSAALQERFPNFNDYYKMLSSTDASGVGALPADFVSQFKVTPK